MVFLLVLSHLVTDQLLAWFHSIHISIYMLSLRPLVAFAFNIRIQHSLELNSARKLNRFCIWKRKFLFRFVARNRGKKNRICVEFPTIFQCVNVVAPRVTRSTPRWVPPFTHFRALAYCSGYCEYDSMSGGTCLRVQFEYNCNWSTHLARTNEKCKQNPSAATLEYQVHCHRLCPTVHWEFMENSIQFIVYVYTVVQSCVLSNAFMFLVIQ